MVIGISSQPPLLLSSCFPRVQVPLLTANMVICPVPSPSSHGEAQQHLTFPTTVGSFVPTTTNPPVISSLMLRVPTVRQVSEQGSKQTGKRSNRLTNSTTTLRGFPTASELHQDLYRKAFHRARVWFLHRLVRLPLPSFGSRWVVPSCVPSTGKREGAYSDRFVPTWYQARDEEGSKRTGRRKRKKK